MATTVGILGYQGCIEPHETILNKLCVPTLRVRTPDELARVDRLILPGGESTTMLKFLKLHDMLMPVREFSKTKPVWGICAGAILAATEVHNPEQESLKIIDIAAHRNFYGSQIDSFSANIDVDLLEHKLAVQLIRAPLLSAMQSQTNAGMLRVHATLNGQPVFFSQGNVWACSFHVELGEDTSLHRCFIELSAKSY